MGKLFARRNGKTFFKRSQEITSSVKRTKDSTAGSLVGEEKKEKERKLNGAGLIVQPAGPRMDQNPAGGKMPQREEKEDVALLVRPVKHIKEGREHHELGKYFKKRKPKED